MTALAITAVVIAVAVLLLLAFVLPALTSLRQPVVHLSMVPWGQYLKVSVVSASKAEGTGYYRVNISITNSPGASNGTSQSMPGLDNASVLVHVGPAVYTVTWQDLDRTGTVDAGDTFLLELSSGTPPALGAVFTFWLLDSSDRPVASSSWMGGQKPVITLSGVSVTGTTAQVSVVGASSAYPLSAYEINLVVNSTSAGTAVILTSSGTMTIVAGSHTYNLTYLDISGNGQLKAGNRITVSGLVKSTAYQLVLIWAADGSQIQTQYWST